MKYKLSQYSVEIQNPKNKNEVFLFNTLSSAIISLSNKEIEFLKEKNYTINELGNLKYLIEEGILVPEDRNEYEYIKYNEFLFQQNFNNDNYLSYVIAPTTGCNLRCKYCFEKGQESKITMSDETIEQIIKFILADAERLKIKKVNIVWFGGEPLLCFNQIIKLGSALKQNLEQNNIEFTTKIITNGILLSKNKAKELKEKCNLKTAQITLDGLEKEYCERKGASPENYKNVIKNIINAAELINIDLRLNVDKLNTKDMKEIANIFYVENNLKDKVKIFFSQLRDYNGVDKDNKVYFTDDEYANEKINFDKYLEKINAIPTKKGIKAIPKYRLIYCALSHANNYAIGPEGELYKCEHYFGKKDRVIGDVWNGLYFNNEYFSHINGVKHGICSKCSLYPICQSTCPETFRLIKFVDDKKCNRYDKLITMLNSIILSNIEQE